MHLKLAFAAALVAAMPVAAEAAPATPSLAESATQPAELLVRTGGPYRRYLRARDCKPYNGPWGYYGNPWCEGGWKYTEDRFDSYSYWYAGRPRYRYWRR
jgi:hypothetical protein